MNGHSVVTEDVRRHYDRLSFFYRALWGNHIHHGYFEDDETSPEAQLKLIRRLAKQARIKEKSRVLDVGCGLGGSALWLANNLDCSVTGITISPVQASIATARANGEGLAHLAVFQVSDAHSLDFPEDSFDAVWVVECSEHLSDKEKFIRDCSRVLKPGGVFALCAWLKREELSEDQSTLVQRVCSGMLCPWLATMNQYVEWMASNGMNGIEVEDITQNVAKTWDRCIELARRPEIKLLLRMTDARIREFVDCFELIRQAYADGAMAYGMFTAGRVASNQ